MPAARCPIAQRACSERPRCPAALPAEGAGRAAILILRFIAAARETGDACCWDAAHDQAEATFGDRRGTLVVAHAGALMRRLDRAGIGIAFLPPPCRRLSSGESLLIGALLADGSDGADRAFDPVNEDVAALARSLAPTDAPLMRQAA